MKSIYNFLFCICIGANSFAQATIKEIKSENFTFPVIELTDSNVARRINDYLQTNLLQQTTLKNPGKKLFDKAKYTANHPGIDELDYKIGLNNSKVLSVLFQGASVGAYPQPFSQSFTFNLQNGELILIEELIQTNALQQITKELKEDRKKLISDHLKSIKQDRASSEDIQMVKESLTSCNEDANLDNFLLDSTGISFRKEGCVPHMIAAWDADLNLNYSYSQLNEKLSAFGRNALGDSETDIKNEYYPSFKKPLHGTVDKYGIVMQLNIREDNSVDGFYYYVSQGICIEVSGYITNNKIGLIEQDKMDKVTAKFEGVISGTLIKGKWINKKTNKSLPFQVEPKKS